MNETGSTILTNVLGIAWFSGLVLLISYGFDTQLSSAIAIALFSQSVGWILMASEEQKWKKTKP